MWTDLQIAARSKILCFFRSFVRTFVYVCASVFISYGLFTVCKMPREFHSSRSCILNRVATQKNRMTWMSLIEFTWKKKETKIDRKKEVKKVDWSPSIYQNYEQTWSASTSKQKRHRTKHIVKYCGEIPFARVPIVIITYSPIIHHHSIIRCLHLIYFHVNDTMNESAIARQSVAYSTIIVTPHRSAIMLFISLLSRFVRN